MSKKYSFRGNAMIWLLTAGLLCLSAVSVCMLRVHMQQSQMAREQAALQKKAALPADENLKQERPMTIALTFDDGPHPVQTPILLDGLKERGVKATFFLIGKSAEQYPELVRRMAEEGHLIGNHTYSHTQLNKCGTGSALEEITRANGVLEQIIGRKVEYLRPPFGCWNAELTEQLKMSVVLWDVDPLDWKVLNSATVVNHILLHAKDGQIVLLHDVYDTSVEAALKVIDLLMERECQFVTVEELMID